MAKSRGKDTIFNAPQRNFIRKRVEAGSYTRYGYSNAAFQKVRSKTAKMYGVSTQTITRVLNGEKV